MHSHVRDSDRANAIQMGRCMAEFHRCWKVDLTGDEMQVNLLRGGNTTGENMNPHSVWPCRSGVARLLSTFDLVVVRLAE